MGALTSTEMRQLTDRHYGRLNAILTGITNGISGNTNNGLAAYIDGAVSDPLLQAAILADCAAIDRKATGTDAWRASVIEILGQTAHVNLYKALKTSATSDAGGGFASWYTYVSATAPGIDAQLHPLIGECVRAGLGEGAFTSGTTIEGVMHPTMVAKTFDRVWTGTEGALVDQTTECASVATNDVDTFAADEDVWILGSRYPFDKVLLEIGQLSSDDVQLSADFKYWNGIGWTLVSDLVDDTAGLTVNGGRIAWTLPTDWVPHYLDEQGTPAVFGASNEEELYYLLIRRKNAVNTQLPLVTWALNVPQPVLTAGNKLFGVPQPPLAICEITPLSTIDVTVIQQPQSDRFELPTTGNSELVLRAITAMTNAVTFTIGYTNAAGTAAATTQTVWAGAIAAGAEKVLALDGTDDLKTVVAATCDVATTNTAGIFVIEVNDYARSITAK